MATKKTVGKPKRAKANRSSGSMQRMGSSLIAQIPTTWLDPLLSGPKAVLGKPPWGCPDIERLLGAIKSRMEKAATDGMSDGL